MEKIMNNPGLQHLAENIFWNLDTEDLKICAQINQSCSQILQNPIFCLSKFKHLSTENRKDWIKAIQSVKSSDTGIAIISYLKWKLKKKALKDLPCYSSPIVQYNSRKTIGQLCKNGWYQFPNYIKIVKILAPLTDNPNAPDKYGNTPIYEAAYRGYTEIVKILAPLTDNPNAPNKWEQTPSSVAKNSEIQRFLESYNPSGKSKSIK